MIDVTIDRDKYIGGSDVPIIMGISPFKTRWQLLLEKAEPAKYYDGGFATDITEYGHTMEPKIRAYINETRKTNYEPNQVIINDMRGDSDGFNGDSILEIKTTSRIHDNVIDYKAYIVQMLFYMKLNKVDKGILAVYERPEDFNEEFDVTRLNIYEIDASLYEDWKEEIDFQLDMFRHDLELVKGNPLLTEEDLQPKDVVCIASEVAKLEYQLKELKIIEQQAKDLKNNLKIAMQNHGIKRWIMNDGTKITLVPDGIDTAVVEFDETAFEIEHPELYKKYSKVKTKKGRAGYIRITVPED